MKKVDLKDLLSMKSPVSVPLNQRVTERYTAGKDLLKEGDIVETIGWLHLAKYCDDWDYHLQISPYEVWKDSCLVVEIPSDRVMVTKSDSLIKLCFKARQWVDKNF